RHSSRRCRRRIATVQAQPAMKPKHARRGTSSTATIQIVSLMGGTVPAGGRGGQRAAWLGRCEGLGARARAPPGPRSGRRNRPALDQLRRAAKAGEVRVVMVAGLDRVARSLRDLLHLLDELTAAGCAVISLRESIDLTTPSGRLLVQLLGAMAEFERELIRERVRAGIARVRATGKTRSGKPIGRPRRAVDLEKVRALRA